MKQISNEEFLQLRENLDNNKILNFVAFKYRGYLDEDELEQAKNIAIWKAHSYHKKGKFTTSLYRYMNFECINLQKGKRNKFNRKLRKSVSPKHRGELDKSYDSVDTRDLLSQLSQREQDVLLDRFDSMSFREIGHKRNISFETARKIYHDSLEKIKTLLEIGV